MNYKLNDFERYAISKGISTNTLSSYERNGFNNSYIEPYILEERQLNVVSLSVFSRLFYDRILFLGTGINSDVANIINAQLLYLNSVGEDDIKLFINSPGGSVYDGLSIYDTMNFITPEVCTYCMGMAASMGSILISSGAKGKRYSLPHGKVMIHQPSTSIGYIKSTDLLIEADEIKKCEDTLYNILAENTGKSFDKIKELCQHDKWYTAQEAVDFGLIDEIVTKAN